jgi:arylsulfatase A-like enzyme
MTWQAAPGQIRTWAARFGVRSVLLLMMKQKSPHHPCMLWLLAALLFAVLPQLRAQSAPNVLFLFLDDWRWDAASFTGNEVITTPHMDTLAAQGTIFENAYVTTAICMVSRASVFMGQHMARHGITAFNQNLSSAKWADSYPKRLDNAGYYLGFIGKHGLGNGFTGLYGTYDFNKGYNGQGSYFGQTIDGEAANGRHLCRFMGDLAVQFIANAANPFRNPGTAPFCLQISWKAPHVQDGDNINPFQPDPAYDSLYASDTIPRAKTDTQAQFDGNLSIFQSGEGTSRWNVRFSTEQKFQDNIKKHHRLIHGVDVQLGRILAALDDPNQDGDTSDSMRANTIIILSSDHGFFLGERRQAGKWYIQEESIRVPMLVVDPRLPATQKGKRVPQMVLNIDIAATILDYAGAAIPSVMQGRSMKPIVDGNPPAAWRNAFFHDHPAVGSGVYRNEGVRTESFSYTRYPNNGNVKQMYDVTVDPYQRTNLAGDPRYASKLAELDALTNQLKSDAQ